MIAALVFIVAWWWLALAVGMAVEPEPDRGEWIEHAEGTYWKRLDNFNTHGG